MNPRSRTPATVPALLAGVLALAFLLASRPAPARDHDNDHRHDYDHYYPARGYRVPALPPNPYTVHYRGNPYYYQGGVWYRPWGPRFVVVAPPIGVTVPLLPPYFTTVWFGGVPYYYADQAYYRWMPTERVYAVTAPPGQADAATTTPPDHADLYVYPSRGQSEATQARDRYECHRWAADQTGFDPTQPLGGVAADESATRRGDYQRAETACLEARGYSVR